MQPQVVDIGLLAAYDPIAAYGIAKHIPRVPISMNCAVSFSSFALNQMALEGDLDTTIATRTWIDNVTFALQQPNVFNGSVFKTQYDAYLKQATGIAVRVTVHAGPKYLVSPQFTPLENFVNMVSTPRWPAGWPLFKQQSIKSEFILNQAPPAVSPNGPPYNVTLTFGGWQFLDYTLDEMSPDEAASRLRAAGFVIPVGVK